MHRDVAVDKLRAALVGRQLDDRTLGEIVDSITAAAVASVDARLEAIVGEIEELKPKLRRLVSAVENPATEAAVHPLTGIPLDDSGPPPASATE